MSQIAPQIASAAPAVAACPFAAYAELRATQPVYHDQTTGLDEVPGAAEISLAGRSAALVPLRAFFAHDPKQMVVRKQPAVLLELERCGARHLLEAGRPVP